MEGYLAAIDVEAELFCMLAGFFKVTKETGDLQKWRRGVVKKELENAFYGTKFVINGYLGR